MVRDRDAKQTILVAGATGVVGRRLLPLLVGARYDVVGLTRDAGKTGLIAQLGARPLVVDVFDREGLLAAFRAERPAIVVHQLTDLAQRDYAANARVRIEGTCNLVDAASAVGVRRMVAQSIAWVYAPGEGPAREEDPLDLDAPSPRSFTVRAVQTLEQTVAALPEGVILRYGTFYGPGTWKAPDGPDADQVRRGAFPATDGITSFTHVDDAARAALLALAWPPGAVNVVDDEPAPGTVWLPIYAAAIGAPPPPIQPGRARGERGASNTKARRELGWEPLYPTWREGFRVTLG